ncbi:hypothetical protein GCM10022420_003910 [Streptomyces iranensis]
MGFVPQPKRWVVEQVNGTLMLHRRLARDYGHRPDNAPHASTGPPPPACSAASPHHHRQAQRDGQGDAGDGHLRQGVTQVGDEPPQADPAIPAGRVRIPASRSVISGSGQ